MSLIYLLLKVFKKFF